MCFFFFRQKTAYDMRISDWISDVCSSDLYRWATRAIMLDKVDATKLLARIRRQWFAKRKSVAAILKEVLTNEASALVDNDASNKAADADLALQELGSDLIGQEIGRAHV